MKKVLVFLAWGLVFVAARSAAAQTGGGFDLTRSGIGGGGGSSSGGGLSLSGIVAPSNSGHSAGGTFTLDGWWDGSASTVAVPGESPKLPTAFAFLPARPNPFVQTVSLEFDLPHPEHVTLAAFDLRGRQVRQLVDEPLAAGRHRVLWDGAGADGKRMATGIYFVKIDAGDFHTASRVVLVH